MVFLRPSTFQSLIRNTRTPFLRVQQRRWAQVHDVRFLATHHDPKFVLDRYRNKLDQKAQQEGHDVHHCHSRTLQPTPSPSTSAVHPPPPPPSPQAKVASEGSGKSSTGIKPLSSYIDVEKVLDLPPKEIEAIWRLRHASNPHSVCAVIPVETYQRISSAARQNPQFVLPLPRTQAETEQSEQQGDDAANAGAEIHFLQWAFHPAAPTVTSGPLASSHTSTIIFTQLAAYQLHGSYAQPHTTITHHLDLADEKGLVLMHGQIMPDSGISSTDATWLVSCVQRFYDFGGQASGRKGELLRSFTKGDTNIFKIEALLEEAEKL
ncbi:putative F1F0 ATP synthase assembly protein Atp11 [Aspergillus nomiae NRRL 13137]|uniref:Putative F1F0 ATP synthase assembly protein Atp11 n=1 Tax=Aspergillus nomiae NRRL (strain ATCC 15546 / NRRL 13137 / CBS 260.88 / M93) TaxID=1509407 RepID=A0A0L1J0P8_ASPN3|nr:putative F1F0 ATP synthase assembly protein Atp11 [Aspergillus nomiae NRRL 13137]KNG85240.1 putative F1F0 ATP synthase assembly protein Atp11 [Aspergillus nomiae NRRL 13137]